MMAKPMISTNEGGKRITREMSDDEFAQWKIDKAQFIEDEKQDNTKEKEHKERSKKLAKELARLINLTENEIAELLRLDIDDAVA